MNLRHHIVKIIWLFSIITFGLGNTLSLQDNVDGTWNVNYESDSAIKRFEFVVDGSDVTSADGGVAEEQSFTIEVVGDTIRGGTGPPFIPSNDSGILVVLELTGTPTGLSGIVILDPSGENLNFTFDPIGCMDNGYQEWSPNFGSPACDFWAFAIIEGKCKYNDCNGVCGGTFDEDCSGTCREEDHIDWDFSCDDCNGIPNGSAYENACEICVGGNTGRVDDCFILKKEDENLYYSDSVYTIQVFAAKNLDGPHWDLDSLHSIDIEFQYDVNLLEMTGFSLYGTTLGNQGYEISYYNIIVEEQPNLMETKSTIFFNPPNSTYNPIVISPNENIFNIILETKFISTESDTTEIKINTISLNENSIYKGDWGEWTILLTPLEGCTDPGACGYNSLATYDDGSCWRPIGGCLCSDGEGAVINECDECTDPETETENCLCGEEDNRQIDCNGDCPPDECPGEFFFKEGCAFRDECNQCVGGATERYPCEEDCNGDLGGNAYYDYCGVECLAADPSANCSEHCIDLSSDDIDCFSASFKIYNSTGNEVENSTIIETENIFVAIFMQNLPNSLEGIIFNLEYNSNILSLNDWSFNPSSVEAEGELTSELNNSHELFVSVDSTFVDSTIFTAVMYATDEPYQGNGGNILFLEFAPLGNSGDSTVLNYNKVQVNEHAMKEQNYTSQVIYFGDLLSNNEYQLIPKGYHLSQNYPNPFNPITYIHYSVPNYKFINIDIINISGQIIKTIVQSSHQPGNYEIMWDGTNHYGISVPSGIYFYKLDADEFISVKKLVLLK